MRLKPRVWFLISLLLFAAAICVWQYAEKRAAERSTAQNRASAAKADALRLQHPPLAKALAANAGAQRKSYRISNTTQTIQQLLHNSHALILRNALIDTEVPVALNIPAHLRAKGAPGSYLVQADRPLDKAFYAELSQAGASYISYVPNNAALVAASPAQATNLAANADVVAVLPYEPYYKLDGTLLPSAVEQQPQTNALSVTTFPGQRDAALAALTQLGATLIGEDRSPFGPTLIVNVPSGSLAVVAQLPLAQEIEAYMPRRLMNDLTRVQLGVSTNTLTNTPDYLNLTGSNVTVNINDTGVTNHPDLAGRLLPNTNDPSSLTDPDGHGTHVAGIIAGSGLESYTVTNLVPGSTNGADFRGKATNARLFVQALNLVAGPFVGDAFLQENAATNLGPTNLISNNSWGYGITPGQQGMYDIHAASYDAATRDALPNAAHGGWPLLFVFAAGNNGNGSDNGIEGASGTITSPGTAKNVITVGASDSPRFITNGVSYDDATTNEVFYGETDNSNLVAYFSSCGNVGLGIEGLYGRFKPDVVAPGVFTISCRAADYVDPTNETIVTDYPYTNQTVPPNQTNIYPFYIPDDTSGLVIIVSSNTASSKPFPTNMLLLGDPFDPPTDILGTNEVTVSNFMSQNIWYFGVASPSNQPGPVEFDLNFYLFETNGLGDYFTVLSNMNSVLGSNYVYQSGTSMSAGAVSGMLALMQEFLQSNPNLGITNPSPALLKAMLINGSRSLGVQYDFNVKTPLANEQGWGLPNITNSLPRSLSNGVTSTNASMLLIDQSPSNALATGQYQTYTINCGDTNAAQVYPLRITLVWTDPPGDPAAGVALVNNLDLTVADSTGANIYIGNDFLGGDIFTEVSSPTNLPPGESDNAVQNIYVANGGVYFTSAGDSINNVQNVYINPANVPIDFPLTVTISGTRVNVNAVTGQTNNILQDYALVVSSDDPALNQPLTIISSQFGATNVTLVTVASNGVPLLHQRVGANEPNLYMTNGNESLTNGNSSQWHFFIFTNNQFSSTTNATNVAFATFLPPNLSIPRNNSADIDLYVSTNVSPLTNLAAFVQSADTSLGRTGTETIIYSNSVVNEVYYIGVKSEDQQAADFGFYAVAQQTNFSTVASDGSITATGTGLPVFIPNAVSYNPALAFAFMVNPNPLAQKIRRATVTLGIQHGNPSVLYGTIQFNGTTVTLNHNSGPPGGFTNTYDDLREDPNSGDVTSDGPGNLTQYVGQQSSGMWLLTEADNALTQTGYITTYSVTVQPQQPSSGFIISLTNNQWFDDYIVVPNDATNLIITASFINEGGGSIGIYLTNFDNLNLNDYGSNNNVANGAVLSLSTNNPVPGGPPWPLSTPPLAGGIWYYGIYNFGPGSVTLGITNYIQESLTPNLVQTYTTNTFTPLTTDAHTQSQICITSGQQVVSLQVGVRINDPNLDNLVLHLISPEGTSVLLFEDRGGAGTNNTELGETFNKANGIIYTVFTDDTNLTTTPIKFAPPPFAEEVDIPEVVLWSNSFETVTNGVYTENDAAPVYLEGWLVTNNVVTIQTTNGLALLTNNRVGIVTESPGDPNYATNVGSNYIGTNYLALTSGRIMQTFGATNFPFTTVNGFAITNGQTYQLRFYAKPLGITHWWPADNNANDIIGADNGTIPDYAGDVVAWGDNSSGAYNVPPPNTGFTAIGIGGNQTLGVKTDGSIVVWGGIGDGDGTVPSPNANFTAVAGGNYSSYGLKTDGSIAAWGLNDWGECNVPSPNTGFTAVTAGNRSGLGLKNDGTIVTWGLDESGVCDVPSPNANFVAVAANGYHALGLKNDGSIVCWGDNSVGQGNVPSPNTGFVAIAAGWDHSLGLKNDGSIVAWGNNRDYNGNYVGECVVPSPNTGFTAVAGGWSFSVGLKSDGSIVAWGRNDLGECTVPSPNTGFTAIAAHGGGSALGLKSLPNVTYDVGEVDRAFTFSGLPTNSNTGNEVDFGTTAGNFGTNDFTIDFWIKQSPFAPEYLYGILEKRGECDAQASMWNIELGPISGWTPNGYKPPAGTLTFELTDINQLNHVNFFANKTINDGNYHHAAFVRNGLNLSIYIDGILNTNAYVAGNPWHAGVANISNTTVFRAGQSICVPYGNGSPLEEPFEGDLDELDLFNRGLSPAEIYAIYHAGSLGKYSTNSILPNFDVTIDGISTNNIILTNASGGWQLFTNSFVANSDQVTIEFSGNALGVLLDDIQLIQLPATNYNNYYLPEEPLTPFVGENPLGCWTLDVWDTRNDSPNPTDGTLLSWTMQVTTSSTNAVLNVLTTTNNATNNGYFITTNVTTNAIVYFAVDVPSYATFATNILTVSNSGSLNLFFDQTALPTGGLPGDVILAGNVTSASPRTIVLATLGAPPPLLPGQRYFLGVQNNGITNATFTIEVDFNGMSNTIIALNTNTVPYPNQVGTYTTNTIGTNAEYYSFVVPANATMVTFQILNSTNGEVDLYARDGMPLPGPLDFDYASANAGTNDQFIVVTTNSVPVALPVPSTNDVVPLPPSTWYLAACNSPTNSASVTNGYTIIATWVTTNEIQIIPLRNGVPANGVASPGYPTNVLYSYTVTNTNAAGIRFTVSNTSFAGNVELLAALGVFPTPEEFYSGSFNAGTSPQLVQIGTSSKMTNLHGTVWYLAVPNTSAANVSYSIEATNIISGRVTNAPLFLGASVSSESGGFTIFWAATSGQTYEVEVSTNLITWTFVTNITTQSTNGSYTDPTPVASQPARFYRLLQVSDASLNFGGSITSPTSGFTMTWAATSNQTYEIDVSTNLLNWAFVTNITTQSTTGSYTDPTPVASQRARFYRLLP